MIRIGLVSRPCTKQNIILKTFVACVPGEVAQVDEHLDGASGGHDVDLVDDVAVALAVARDGEVAVDVGAEAVQVHPESVSGDKDQDPNLV